MKIKVLLVSKMAGNIENILKMADDEAISVVGVSSGGIEALENIDRLSPDIVLMTLGAGDEDVFSLTERITLGRPRCYVILLAEYLDVETIQKAIAAGTKNVSAYPKTAKELTDNIKSVFNSETARIESLSGKQSSTWLSRVITVFGAKGGLGKTTISTNLAVKLASMHKKVALIDLDLQFGDVHIFMDIDPSDTISELVSEMTAPSIDLIRSFMTVHPSGVHVLCAPKSPEYAELVPPDKIQSILRLLRSYYDYVIIDTPPGFSDNTITALEASSTILFVTGLDISILKNSKLSLSLLESLQLTDKIRLIVNRAENVSTITLNDVCRLITCPIWAKIPSDYKVAVSALNRGIPIVTGNPNSELARSLSVIAELLSEGKEDLSSLNPVKIKSLGLKGLPGIAGTGKKALKA